jgi:hypothetical protein
VPQSVNVFDYLDEDQVTPTTEKPNGSRSAEVRAPPPHDEDDDFEETMTGALPPGDIPRKFVDDLRAEEEGRAHEESSTQDPDDLEQSMVSSTFTDVTAKTSKSEGYADRRSEKSSRRTRDDDDVRSEPSGRSRKDRDREREKDRDRDRDRDRDKEKRRSSRRERDDDDDSKSVAGSIKSEGSSRRDKDKKKKKSDGILGGLFSRSKTDLTESSSSKSKSKRAEDEDDDRERRKRKKDRDRDRERRDDYDYESRRERDRDEPREHRRSRVEEVERESEKPHHHHHHRDVDEDEGPRDPRDRGDGEERRHHHHHHRPDEDEVPENRRERDDEPEERPHHHHHHHHREYVDDEDDDDSRPSKRRSDRDHKRSELEEDQQDQSFLGDRAEEVVKHQHDVERDESAPLPVKSLVLGGLAATAAAAAVGVAREQSRDRRHQDDVEEREEEKREIIEPPIHRELLPESRDAERYDTQEKHFEHVEQRDASPELADSREVEADQPPIQPVHVEEPTPKDVSPEEHATRDVIDDAPPEQAHVQEPQQLPEPEHTSPMEASHVPDLPDLPLSRPHSPIEVGSFRDLPDLPDSRSHSPIEVGSFRDLPDLPDSRPHSPIEVGSFRDLPDLPNSRPHSPIEVGSHADLPDLPPSRPGSPYEEQPKTPPRPSLESLRAASTTAVPFRLPGRQPSSPMRPNAENLETPPSGRPGHKKSRSGDFRGSRPKPLQLVESLRSPARSSDGSPITPFGRRYSHDPVMRNESPDATPRNSSGRRTLQEHRPMWLVSKHAPIPAIEAESLPSLPPSREESRSPSSEVRKPLEEEDSRDVTMDEQPVDAVEISKAEPSLAEETTHVTLPESTAREVDLTAPLAEPSSIREVEPTAVAQTPAIEALDAKADVEVIDETPIQLSTVEEPEDVPKEHIPKTAPVQHISGDGIGEEQIAIDRSSAQDLEPETQEIIPDAVSVPAVESQEIQLDETPEESSSTRELVQPEKEDTTEIFPVRSSRKKKKSRKSNLFEEDIPAVSDVTETSEPKLESEAAEDLFPIVGKKKMKGKKAQLQELEESTPDQSDVPRAEEAKQDIAEPEESLTVSGKKKKRGKKAQKLASLDEESTDVPATPETREVQEDLAPVPQANIAPGTREIEEDLDTAPKADLVPEPEALPVLKKKKKKAKKGPKSRDWTEEETPGSSDVPDTRETQLDATETAPKTEVESDETFAISGKKKKRSKKPQRSMDWTEEDTAEPTTIQEAPDVEPEAELELESRPEPEPKPTAEEFSVGGKKKMKGKGGQKALDWFEEDTAESSQVPEPSKIPQTPDVKPEVEPEPEPKPKAQELSSVSGKKKRKSKRSQRSTDWLEEEDTAESSQVPESATTPAAPEVERKTEPEPKPESEEFSSVSGKKKKKIKRAQKAFDWTEEETPGSSDVPETRDLQPDPATTDIAGPVGEELAPVSGKKRKEAKKAQRSLDWTEEEAPVSSDVPKVEGSQRDIELGPTAEEPVPETGEAQVDLETADRTDRLVEEAAPVSGNKTKNGEKAQRSLDWTEEEAPVSSDVPKVEESQRDIELGPTTEEPVPETGEAQVDLETADRTDRLVEEAAPVSGNKTKNGEKAQRSLDWTEEEAPVSSESPKFEESKRDVDLETRSEEPTVPGVDKVAREEPITEDESILKELSSQETHAIQADEQILEEEPTNLVEEPVVQEPMVQDDSMAREDSISPEELAVHDRSVAHVEVPAEQEPPTREQTAPTESVLHENEPIAPTAHQGLKEIITEERSIHEAPVAVEEPVTQREVSVQEEPILAMEPDVAMELDVRDAEPPQERPAIQEEPTTEEKLSIEDRSLPAKKSKKKSGKRQQFDPWNDEPETSSGAEISSAAVQDRSIPDSTVEPVVKRLTSKNKRDKKKKRQQLNPWSDEPETSTAAEQSSASIPEISVPQPIEKEVTQEPSSKGKRNGKKNKRKQLDGWNDEPAAPSSTGPIQSEEPTVPTGALVQEREIEQPVTENLAGEDCGLEQPANVEPALNEPVISEHVTKEPVIPEHVVKEPVDTDFTTNDAVTHKPTREESIVITHPIERSVPEELGLEQPIIKDPIAQERAIEKSVITVPAIEESTIEEPPTEEPTIRKDIVDEPTTEEVTPKSPTIKEPVIDESTPQQAVVEDHHLEDRSIVEPTIKESIEESTAENLTVEEPAIKKLSIGDHTIEERATEEPIIEEPIVQERYIQDQFIAEPILREPAAEISSIEHAAAGPSIIEEQIEEPGPILEKSVSKEEKKVKKSKRRQLSIQSDEPEVPTESAEIEKSTAEDPKASEVPPPIEEVNEEPEDPEDPSVSLYLSKRDKKKARKAAKAKKLEAFTSAEDTEVSTPAEPIESLQHDSVGPVTEGTPHSNIDLAAASAAALEESGFDTGIVLDDPTFSRPSSRAHGLEEPDFDDFPQHASRKGSRRGSRRQSRAQSLDRGIVEDKTIHEHESGPIKEAEFAALVAQGLHHAGFDPSVHKDTQREDHTRDIADNDLYEISAMRHSPKSAWGKPGKRRSKEDLVEEDSGTKAVEQTVQLDLSRETMEESQPAEAEEDSAVPVNKKKGKRKKKKVKGYPFEEEPSVETSQAEEAKEAVAVEPEDEWALPMKKKKVKKPKGIVTTREEILAEPSAAVKEISNVEDPVTMEDSTALERSGPIDALMEMPRQLPESTDDPFVLHERIHVESAAPLEEPITAEHPVLDLAATRELSHPSEEPLQQEFADQDQATVDPQSTVNEESKFVERDVAIEEPESLEQLQDIKEPASETPAPFEAETIRETLAHIDSDPTESLALSRKKKKNKKNKMGRNIGLQDEKMVEDSTPTESAVEATPEIVERSLPVKKKRDKKQKGKAAISLEDETVKESSASEVLPETGVNASAVKEWDMPTKKKKGKTRKKGKEAWTEEAETEREAPTSEATEPESMGKDVAIGMGAALAAAGATAAASHLLKSSVDDSEYLEIETPHTLEGSEATKRSIPAGFDDSKNPPRKMARTSQTDLDAMEVELPEGSKLGPAKEVQKQISAQDLNEATWAFPENRDSAIVVDDSPVLRSGSPMQSNVRDSGFQEPPVTPVAGKSTTREHSEIHSPRSRRTSRSTPKSPIGVQVQVPADWDVQVTQDEDERTARRASQSSLPDTHDMAEMQRSLPPAVESTTRDRASALLFQSSPSSRETPSFVGHKHADIPSSGLRAESPDRNLDVAELEHDSPLLRKISQMSVSGPAQGLLITGATSSPPRALSPSSAISSEEVIARRPWPTVDEENETVGIDAVLHGQETQSTPIASPRSSQPHVHTLHHTSPSNNLRSASIASDRSSGSLSRLKSPDLGRPMSAASNRSEGLRRIGSRKSGDLRSLSRGSRISPVPSMVPLAAAAALATSTDSRSRGADMEGIYVSFYFMMCLSLFKNDY